MKFVLVDYRMKKGFWNISAYSIEQFSDIDDDEINQKALLIVIRF